MPKTILITGSTDGIGKHLAMKLASEGHEVILHGRNSEKLRVALSDIQKQEIQRFTATLQIFPS